MRTNQILAASCISLLAGILPVCGQADFITTVDDTPGLLGFWNFTPSTQANSSVNGYTGTFEGNAAVGAAQPDSPTADDTAGTALLLDGSGSFINTSLTGQIAGQGSMIAWFNLSALPSSVGHIFAIAGMSEDGNDFDLQIETDNEIKFYTDGGSATIDTTPLTFADLNTWLFVAATFTSGTDRNIYLEGSLVASSTPGAHSLSDGTFAIGESDVFTGRFFNGEIDDVAVFDRELSPTEVSNIYASAQVVPEPAAAGLVLGAAAFFIAVRLRRNSSQS